MTHGLFLQKAADFERVVDTYAAVIIDEAHERSVEIDLTLALMAQLLSSRAAPASSPSLSSSSSSSASLLPRPFKVVIASATIAQEARALQDFFSPLQKDLSSCTLPLPGTSFPVHVEHCDDLPLDAKVIGSGGVGQVISSYAVQTAIDLLYTTD
jgi:HrpA-like RNA helicase